MLVCCDSLTAMTTRRSPSGLNDPLGSAKDAAERELARKLGKALAAQLGRLMEFSPEELSRLPQSFWDEEARLLLAWMSPELQKMVEDAAVVTVAGFPVGADWALINQEALNWAATYAFDLVKGITATSAETVRKAVSAFISTPGVTTGDIVDRIASTFGAVRAESIAVTEVTRAYAQGQILAADQARALGLGVSEVWQTNRDELVCPLCGPNQGKPRGQWTVSNAPAHPRCRCWYSHEWSVT